MLLHPLDLIKTRMQVQDQVQAQEWGGQRRLPSYNGVWHACRRIVTVEGWLGLSWQTGRGGLPRQAKFFRWSNLSKSRPGKGEVLEEALKCLA